MKRGEIWMVDLDPTQGRGHRGHRPVLIVSPDPSDRETRLPVVLPISNGGDFARRIGFAVALSGLTTTGVVRSDQPRVCDLAGRNGRYIEALPPTVLDEVTAGVVTTFE